jgi:hypothetical protein
VPPGEELRARVMLLGGSVLEHEKTEPCASCGKPSPNRTVTEPDNTALCGICANRRRTRTEEESSPTPEERFDGTEVRIPKH